MQLLFSSFYHYFIFFGWRDCLEIIFFSSIFYFFSRWLFSDTQKNLLFSFYNYWLIAFASYFLQLTSITFFLFAFAPVICVIFIVIHQKTLQKNFISYTNKTSIAKDTDHWLDTLVRLCLQTAHKDKQLFFIIERYSSLQDFLNIPFKIHTDFNNALLSMLIDAPSFEQSKFILMNHEGYLLGINVSSKITIDKEWIDTTLLNSQTYKDHSYLLTHQTDALIVGVTPQLKPFTVIFDGTFYEQLTTEAAMRLLKRFILTQNQKDFKNGYLKKTSHHQLSR